VDAAGEVPTSEAAEETVSEKTEQLPDGVDQEDLSWILHTSVEDATHRIARTDLATLKHALEQEKTNGQRKSLIAVLERKIRKMEKQEAAK
jgi:hypothetical protein